MELPFDRTIRRRIHLMRHAEAEYIRADGTRAPDSRLVPLTPRGRVEAEAMGALLKATVFDKAVCSGLPRTKETARFVLGDRPLPLEIVPALEEIRGGDAVARARLSPVDYAYAMFQASGPDACYAAGEKFADFVARVVPAFNDIIATTGWSSLLLVAHGGVNRAVLTDVTGSGLSAFGAFEQDSGCLNIIDIDTCLDTGAVLRRILRGVNITAQDPAKRDQPLTYMEGFVRKSIELGAFPGKQP